MPISNTYSNKSNQLVVLITGCSTGIGLQTALILKERGYRVFATARDIKDVEELKSQGLESLVLDVDDSASIDQAIKSLLEQTDGKLYALFNNAGYGQTGAVQDLPRESIRAQFETNVFGPIELISRVLPIMKANKSGRIIQNSSILGFAALRFRGAYNASKYALEGFSDTLRLELQGTGVYVSLIQPGPIESMFRNTAHKMFLKNIDYKNSDYTPSYEAALVRLGREKNEARFCLGPEHVAKRVIHALESNKPKSRYPVTVPTYAFAILKRFLPDSILDKIKLKVA